MTRPPPVIDMLPDGTFASPPRAQPGMGVPTSMKVGIGAALVAVVGLALTIAAVAVYVVSLILPVVIIAGVVAWGALKYRRWQSGRGQVAPAQASRFRQ